MFKINLNYNSIILIIKWLCIYFLNEENDIKFGNIIGGTNNKILPISKKLDSINIDININGEISIKGVESDFSKKFESLLQSFINKEIRRKLEDFSNISNAIVFLDLANMFHWQDKVGWSFNCKYLAKHLSSIKAIKEVRVYYGTKQDNDKSENFLRMLRQMGAIVKTKEVKMITKHLARDGANIFIKQQRLACFSDKAIEKVDLLVAQLREEGQIVWQEPKCNFDVEISLDMIDASERAENLILFTGDSDFLEPINRIRLKGRKVYVVCSSGFLSAELRDNNDGYINFNIFRPIIERFKIEKPA